jgi:hypothetical protein
MVKIVDVLNVQNVGKWFRFGKIIIHYDNLDDLKLNCKYASGSQIPKLPKTSISEEMSALLMSLIDTQEINFQLAKQLKDSEKDLLVQLMKTSGLSKQLNFTKSKIEPSRSDLKLRYNVLIGEIEAGNNSEVIVQELKTVIEKLIKLNLIAEDSGKEMIDELKDIS